MRGIVIDVTTHEIKECWIKSYKDYYPLLHCDTFDVVMSNDSTISAFVDDEGLLKSGNPLLDIRLLGFPQPYAGSIVLMGGIDAEGETLPLPDEITLDAVIDIARIVGETK